MYPIVVVSRLYSFTPKNYKTEVSMHSFSFYRLIVVGQIQAQECIKYLVLQLN